MSANDGGPLSLSSSSHVDHAARKHSKRRRGSSALHESTSQNLSSLLILMSERLEQETRRADEAERKAAECLSRLRSALDAKNRTDYDMARVSEELRLYKIQLDVAQKEIYRAQEIVQQVENARVEADASAAKARSVARQYQEEFVVMQARDEGKKLGYKEGLKKGRRVGFEEGRAFGFVDGHDEYHREYHRDDRDDRRSERSPPRVLEPVRPPSRSSRSRPRREPDHTDPGPSQPSSSRIPDVAPFARILPVPTLVTPTPSLRQSVPLAVPSPAHSPELIHPRSRPTSPAPSTDGWIPTADRNSSYIGLPPPHALSDPAAIILATSPRSTARSIDTSADPQAHHPQVRSRDYAYPPPTQPSDPQTPVAGSRRSTRMSDFDLVSPPRQRSQPPSVGSNHIGQEPGRTLQREPSQPERIAEDWRRANPDIIIPRSGAAAYGTNVGPTSYFEPRGRVEVPSPVIVAKRVETYENAALANNTVPPPPSPTRERMGLGKKFKFLTRGLSNASSVPQINVDPPSTSPSKASSTTHLDQKNMLSPTYKPQPLPHTDVPIEPLKPVRSPRKSPAHEIKPVPTYNRSESPAPLNRPISLFSDSIEQ